MTLQDEDRVGYRRPPRNAQFKPGQSGNPHGRPPRFPGMFIVLRDVLEEPAKPPKRAKRSRMSKFEAVAQQTVAKAIEGDARILRLLFKELGSKEARDSFDAKFRDMMEESRETIRSRIENLRRGQEADERETEMRQASAMASLSPPTARSKASDWPPEFPVPGTDDPC
jgi:hypothetical protein